MLLLDSRMGFVAYTLEIQYTRCGCSIVQMDQTIETLKIVNSLTVNDIWWRVSFWAGYELFGLFEILITYSLDMGQTRNTLNPIKLLNWAQVEVLQSSALAAGVGNDH